MEKPKEVSAPTEIWDEALGCGVRAAGGSGISGSPLFSQLHKTGGEEPHKPRTNAELCCE